MTTNRNTVKPMIIKRKINLISMGTNICISVFYFSLKFLVIKIFSQEECPRCRCKGWQSLNMVPLQ